MKKRTRTRVFAWSSLAFVLTAIAGAIGPARRWFSSSESAALEGMPVQRGDLLISELVRGNLKAKNSVSLKSELEGRSTILFLIEEGTIVEKGQVVAELDVSGLEDDLVSQRISVQNAEADFTKAREQFDIQKIQNETDIASAELDLQFAKDDQEKYTIADGEWTHEQRQAEETIALAEEDLKRAETTLEYTQKLYDEGFVQRTELESDEAAVHSARITLEQAKRDKALKEKYGHRRRLAELEAAVETMEREVQKVKKQALAKLADYEAARESASYTLDLEKQKLAKLEALVGKGKLRAPVAGMVVYAREESRWGRGEPVAEGVEVRERQEIVTIPQTGGMIVESSLHETVLERVQLGQPCKITIGALPGRSCDGRVAFVAMLPDPNAFWANPNQRLYRAELSIDEPTPDMRPGMSCDVEILSAQLKDVLYVPVQAIFLDAGETVCFVKSGAGVEQRDVTVGLDNSKWVVVESGLAEGELVCLTAPPGFKPGAAAPDPADFDEFEPGLEMEGMGAQAGGPPAGFGGPLDGEGRPDGERGEGGEGGDPEALRALYERMRSEGGADGERPDFEALRAEFERRRAERGAGAGGERPAPGDERSRGEGRRRGGERGEGERPPRGDDASETTGGEH